MDGGKVLFDQCGVVMYLDSENWLKASIEYENERFQRLGSVVTNLGYSDWATTDINAAAYLVTTQKGAIRSMPQREQVESFL